MCTAIAGLEISTTWILAASASTTTTAAKTTVVPHMIHEAWVAGVTAHAKVDIA